MKEYAFMVRSMELSLNVSSKTPDEIGRELSIDLMDLAHDVNKQLKTPVGNDWEIVSHGLTRLDGHLVASFLISRDR